jgi:hypothetical protein
MAKPKTTSNGVTGVAGASLVITGAKISATNDVFVAVVAADAAPSVWTTVVRKTRKQVAVDAVEAVAEPTINLNLLTYDPFVPALNAQYKISTPVAELEPSDFGTALVCGIATKPTCGVAVKMGAVFADIVFSCATEIHLELTGALLPMWRRVLHSGLLSRLCWRLHCICQQ